MMPHMRLLLLLRPLACALPCCRPALPADVPCAPPLPHCRITSTRMRRRTTMTKRRRTRMSRWAGGRQRGTEGGSCSIGGGRRQPQCFRHRHCCHSRSGCKCLFAFQAAFWSPLHTRPLCPPSRMRSMKMRRRTTRRRRCVGGSRAHAAAGS